MTSLIPFDKLREREKEKNKDFFYPFGMLRDQEKEKNKDVFYPFEKLRDRWGESQRNQYRNRKIKIISFISSITS